MTVHENCLLLNRIYFCHNHTQLIDWTFLMFFQHLKRIMIFELIYHLPISTSSLPIEFMYGIFRLIIIIYHKDQPNVGKSTIYVYATQRIIPVSRWLGSPPCISHNKEAIWKGSHNPILREQKPTMVINSTYLVKL